MGLADFRHEFRTVAGKGGSFHVYGLSLTEIAPLVTSYFDDLDALWDIADGAISGKVSLTDDDLGRLCVAFAKQAPGFVASVIALATHEPGEEVVNNAARIPLPLQIEALINIFQLTFDEVGGVKKFMESITGLLKMNQKLKAPAEQ